ncbi:MAG TPA: farnesyl diphosphate synthase [Xanthomonadales bacterium]|nr:farnesyl diphosphate synthase [Xanthomonadales bacterium]
MTLDASAQAESFQKFHKDCCTRIESVLEQHLPTEDIIPERLHQAMRYAALGGGKRFRPLLVYATGHALEIEPQELDNAACAVELIHAYSLIHDDLPAMDDDDLRRGKPSCHRAFDEATAILAGDALQSLAFQVLAQDGGTAEVKLHMLEQLAVCSGSRGMAGGQAIDLDATGKDLNQAELENMHIHKTGELIRASVNMAALYCPQLPEAQFRQLDHYAKCVGLAFQIHDDILDEIATTEELGKTQGKDRSAGKPTYPAIIGLTASQEMACALHQNAIDSLSSFGDSAQYLRAIANLVVSRSH